MPIHSQNMQRQSGASLVIGLILLLVLSVLAVSTMSTASFGLTMVGNSQFGENAFQMAETAMDVARTRAAFTTAPGGNLPIPVTTVLDGDGDTVGTYAATINFEETTPIPGYSAGVFVACHFQIQGTGTSAKLAVSTNQQEFYLACPGGS